jgi:hypothetical protein
MQTYLEVFIMKKNFKTNTILEEQQQNKNVGDLYNFRDLKTAKLNSILLFMIQDIMELLI